MDRVMITGLGFVTPCGIGREVFWKNLCYGPSMGAKVELCDAEGIGSQVAAQVLDFDGVRLGLPRKQAERLDRFAQFGLLSAVEAVDDAELQLEREDRDRIGVVTGSAVGSATNTEKEWKKVSANGQQEINAGLRGRYLYDCATPHQLTLEVKNQFDISGPCITLSTGCTTGIDVVGTALNMIQAGEVDVCICGSSDAPITRIALTAFDRVGTVASHFNHLPEKASRPFDNKRNGFVLGEGAAFLVFETLEHALNRKAVIYSELLSYYSSCNAIHMTTLKKDDDSTSYTIEAALKKVNMNKDRVGLISAHGSGTRQNDIHETNSYKSVFQDRVKKIPINGLKSTLGHSLGGIGSITVGASALAIKYGIIPPTKNYEEPDPECDLDYVPNEPREAQVDVAVVNGSSFSGMHSTVVLQKY